MENDIKRAFDGRGPHKFATRNVRGVPTVICLRCSGIKSQLGNLVCCSGNKAWGLANKLDWRGPHKFETRNIDGVPIVVCVQCSQKRSDMGNLVCCSGDKPFGNLGLIVEKVFKGEVYKIIKIQNFMIMEMLNILNKQSN